MTRREVGQVWLLIVSVSFLLAMLACFLYDLRGPEAFLLWYSAVWEKIGAGIGALVLLFIVGGTVYLLIGGIVQAILKLCSICGWWDEAAAKRDAEYKARIEKLIHDPYSQEEIAERDERLNG
jgi:hypothetical protein